MVCWFGFNGKHWLKGVNFVYLFIYLFNFKIWQSSQNEGIVYKNDKILFAVIKIQKPYF